MIVYMDVIFLVNFVIDGAVLSTTAWSRKIKPNYWRIAAAAAIGASYVVMMLFPPLSFLFTFIVKCLFSILMIMTAFGFRSLQYFLQNLGAFYLINFAAAGGIFALHYFRQSSGEVMNGIVFSQSGGGFFIQVGLIGIILAGGGVLLFYRSVIQSARRREEVSSYMAEVQVIIADSISVCPGLIDTGNQLYDPLTRSPVMVMEASVWKDVLPEEVLTALGQKDDGQWLELAGSGEFPWPDRLRLVPCRSVTRGSPFLLAVKPDKVVVRQGDKWTETSKVLVGLDGGSLSTDGSYRAIIHPMLVQS